MKGSSMTVLSNKTVLLLIVLIGWVCFEGVCFASQSGNSEYWQGHNIGVDINEDYTFTFSEEMRFGKSGSDPYFHNVVFGLVYKGLADWLDISFDFKKEYERDSSGQFRHENRPNLNLYTKGTLWTIPVSNRSRLEWRDFETKEAVWRFRNKTTIKLPFKVTEFNLQPYIAEEWFINLGENNVNQNRLSSGFSFKLTENLSACVFYLYKTSKITGGWRDTNVIGTQFKLLF
jgi:hypothetical protein